VTPHDIDFKSYGLMLRRRRWLILGVVGGFLAAAIALNLFTQPVYRATTRIEVRKEPSRSPLTGEAIASYSWNSDNVALYTAAELVTNRELLREVVDALRASGSVHMGAGRSGGLRALGRRVFGPAPVLGVAGAAVATQAEAGQTERDINREIDWLLRITTVKPISETRLVAIQVDHWDPASAKAIADTLAQKFVAHEERKRSAADTNRLGYLRQQIEEVKGRIEQAERVLYNSHSLGLTVMDDKLKQMNETLGHLNEAYVKAKTDRLATEARLALVRKALKDTLLDGDALPVQSESVQGLLRELLQTRTELARAREVYKGKHPKLMMLESQLTSTQLNLRAELRKAVGALEAEYATLKGREDGLSASITQSESDLRELNDRQGQHSALESDLKSNRDIYALLNAKAQEVRITGEVSEALVAVVDPATLSSSPVRPRKSLNMFLGLAVGLMSGAGLALLMESLRRTFKTPKDVTDALQLQVLGMIPKCQP
jgi:uncharacterized protein involved in exopolysaccharide biosynthesis